MRIEGLYFKTILYSIYANIIQCYQEVSGAQKRSTKSVRKKNRFLYNI